MKIYEKPMALVNNFDIEDVIAASAYTTNDLLADGVISAEQQAAAAAEGATQGVVFQW